MKRVVFILALLALLSFPINAQFVDRITRPCAAGATPRALVITNPNSNNNVEITTCVGGSLLLNGAAIVPGAGTTINATNGVLPYRLNAGAFADSPLTRTSATVLTSTAAFNGPDGGVNTATYSFGTEPTLGLFRFGAGQLGITSAGTVGWFDTNGWHGFGTKVEVFNDTATSTDGFIATTNGNATVGVQKLSPRLRLSGAGWKTNAAAGSQVVDWVQEVVPVQGTSNPSSLLRFSSQINAGGYTPRVEFNSSGGINAANLTLSGLVNGYIPYAGTAGLLSNNTTFGPFWDNSNNELRVGPTASTFGAFGGGTGIFHARGDSGVSAKIRISSAGNISWLACDRTNGSIASPTSLLSGDVICNIVGVGNYGNAAAYVHGPQIEMRATENWDITHNGNGIKFYTIQNASTTQAVSLSLNDDGIGSNVFPGSLTVGDGTTGTGLKLGGSSASFAQIRGNGTTVQFTLANGSAFTETQAKVYQFEQHTDTGLSRISGGLVGVGTGTLGSFAGNLKLTNLTAVGLVSGSVFQTATNCADFAGAAACGSAAAGAVVIDAGSTTVVVSTTAVTATSRIFVQEDSSLATELGITCNATIARQYFVTARTAATSFTITANTAPITNPACLSYTIIN